MNRCCAVAAVIVSSLLPSLAYTPGSGSLYTANFDAAMDDDWENGDGNSASPWTQVLDGGDKVLYADGKGPTALSPTRHWARHPVVPVTATSFSIALEFRADLGTAYRFDLDLNQRAPDLRKLRLRINGGGTMSLWRSENGAMVQKAVSAPGLVPIGQKRWIRLQIDAGSPHPVVHARAWSGGAAAEPASGWTLEFVDDLDTLARVHTFELAADGPKGIQTWLDDLDAWGDANAGVASSITKIYLTEWTHLDIGFTLPPDDIEAYAKTHLDQVLLNLAADPDYHWTIEEAWYLDRWWERSTDAERETMLAWLRDGRLRLAAGYATLHSTSAGHEELVRNLYWASKFARQHDVPLRFWISDDVPGTSFALPEILARSGIEYYFGGMNTPFGGRLTHPNHGERPFWWVGPDGSRVLSWITFDAYAEAFDYGFSWFDSLADLHRKLGRKLPEQEEAGYRFPELMLMRAFDNNYAGFKARDLVDQWNATYATPKFVLATPDEFMDHMLQAYGPDAFPSFSGDFGCAWSNSHADQQHIETWVREAHRKGRNAEALLAIGAAADAQPVDHAKLDFLYRRELEVDEHSGAGGWPGYWNPEQMERNNRIHVGYAQDASATARSLLEEGFGRVLAAVDPGRGVLVVNPTARTRDGWARFGVSRPDPIRIVDTRTGQELPYQRWPDSGDVLFRAPAVPGFGYAAFDVAFDAPQAQPGGQLDVTPTSLDNDFYRVVIDPADGSVTSLFAKATGRELVDAASPFRFNRLASNVSGEITWRAAPNPEPPGVVTVTIDSTGPMVGALHVRRTGTPHAETIYRLYRGEDRVEIENVLDRDRMPYVPNATGSRAYTVTLPFDVHDFQIRSESTTRFVDPLADGFARTEVFDWHNVEHTLAFWDATGGVLYGVDSVDSHFFEGLTTMPMASFAHHDGLVLSRLYDRADEYEFADGSIGPFTMEPGTGPILRYVHSIRTTGPSFDPVAASRFGQEAQEPLLARYVDGDRKGRLAAPAASFLAIDAPNVFAYTLKPAEDGDGWIVRLLELTGAPATTVRLSSDVFTLADPLRVGHDESGGTPLAIGGGAVLVPVGPYETATVRVRATLPVVPISLALAKGAGGTVHLSWSGGSAPYTLVRADDPQFTVGVTTLVDAQPVTSYDDPVLNDGRSYYYDLR